ncbi:MAG: glycoside hydrolase family 15 [Propionibacteriaceae bacterium]|nr:glycoside hydrolase family 15 [Propionibacteriaceae bacterium]
MTTVTVHRRIDLVERSRQLIQDLQDPSGAYPASSDFSAYQGYCWFRDGSFIADGMSAVGAAASASAFFDWCARVLEANRPQICQVVAAARAGRPLPDRAMLPARFHFDGSPGRDDWWDFQLDGYGTWLWAVVEHAERHRLDLARWREAIELTTDYLVSSWDRPCYDWWEEHDDEIHISTLGCVLAGLKAVVARSAVTGERAEQARSAAQAVEDTIWRQGVADGHLVKWIGSQELDGSLSALLAPLAVVDPNSELGLGTVAALEDQLLADGGVYRFRADTFFGGGRWPLLTCFLGLARQAQGDRRGALDCLDWAGGTATPSGDLPEQVDGGLLLDRSWKQPWIDRWGAVATPLLWSHAMYLRLAAALDLVPPTDPTDSAPSSDPTSSRRPVSPDDPASSRHPAPSRRIQSGPVDAATTRSRTGPARTAETEVEA